MADDSPAGDDKARREEFQEARRALVDRMVKDNPGLKPSDFNDVKISDFDTHAAQMNQQRLQAQADLLGVSVDDLPAALARAKGETLPDPGHEETPQQRHADLGALGGRPANFDSRADEDRGLTEHDLIRAALVREAKQKR